MLKSRLLGLDKKNDLQQKAFALYLSVIKTREMPKTLHYFPGFFFPLLLLISIYLKSNWLWSVPLAGFLFIPLMEQLMPRARTNPKPLEEPVLRQNKAFDFLLYANVPLVYLLIFLTARHFMNSELPWYLAMGWLLSLGMVLGVNGINVAHELGHRKEKGHHVLALALLLPSFYNHFFIEHNHGHHRWVSTDRDPASARFNEPLYLFWFRSMAGTWFSAWRIEAQLLQKQGKSSFSLHNRMLHYVALQLGYVLLLYLAFGPVPAAALVFAGLVGILMLETVNYIEHYGLRRKETAPGRYEPVQPWHSWNSDHALGRFVLFELPRHSDHHYRASRKYQTLRHREDAPGLPLGYPGSMLLAMLPPLWFRLMNPRVKALELEHQQLQG